MINMNEEIIVMVRHEKVIGKINQFIGENKLRPEYINNIFTFVHKNCTKGINIAPEFYLYDIDDVDKCLLSLNIDHFQKVE